MVNKKYLNWDSIVHLCGCFNLPTVSVLYEGPWNLKILELAEAIDEYDNKKFNREGIVIRLVKDRSNYKCGRVIMKFINPKYLLDKGNTDYH